MYFVYLLCASTLKILIHLFLIITLWDKHCYYLYRGRGHWGRARLRNLPEGIQLTSARARIWTQSCWLQSPRPEPFYTTLSSQSFTIKTTPSPQPASVQSHCSTGPRTHLYSLLTPPFQQQSQVVTTETVYWPSGPLQRSLLTLVLCGCLILSGCFTESLNNWPESFQVSPGERALKWHNRGNFIPTSAPAVATPMEEWIITLHKLMIMLLKIITGCPWTSTFLSSFWLATHQCSHTVTTFCH